MEETRRYNKDYLIRKMKNGGDYVRSDASFSFPYGFKHGTILVISEEEYARMKDRDWKDVEDRR